MNLKRFVRVVTGGTKPRCGTGYFLDGQRVLTARHVVADAETVTVEYDDLAGKRVKTDVKSTWTGNGELDVAVLGVETDLRVARPLLCPEPLACDQPWRSRGWARARLPPEDSSSVLTSLTPLWGTAAEFVKTARRFEIGVEAPPKSAEWWSGVSGAPVFCGWQLVGVIASGPKNFSGGRLRAVPVAALWDAPGFLKAIGYDASVAELRELRRRQLLDDLTDILKGHRKATLAIAAERTAWKDLLSDPQDFDGQVRALAESICNSPSWREVLEAFYSAYENLSRRDGSESDRDAQAIVRLLERALPEVYGATSLDGMGSGDTGHLITLPVETETLAELAMAAFDGRGLAYEEVRSQQDYPSGRARFELPGQQLERGFDPLGDQAWLEWLEMLARWVKLPEAKVQALGGTLRLTGLAKLVNHAFDREVRHFREPRRYFAYPSRFASTNSAFLARVRESLPALHLVELAGDTLADELIECDPLQVILFRAHQRRNPET
jgi:hypothetical protein